MAFGDNLTSQTKITGGDQVIILSERNGGARRATAAAFAEYFKTVISTSTPTTPTTPGVPSTNTPPAWGSITGLLASQTDLTAALAGKQAKLPTGGNASNYLRGDGTWATPPTSTSTTTTVQARWGQVTGTLADQTDLNNLLKRLLPEGGAAGQILSRTSTGYIWIDPPSGGTTPTQPTDPTTPEDYTEETAAMDSSGSNMRTQTASLT